MRQSSVPQGEPEELAKFRAEWKAEVERRAPTIATGPPQERGQEITGIPDRGRVNRPVARTTAGAHSTIPSSSTTQWVVSSGTLSSFSVFPGLGSALGIYRRAVQHEQRGELDDALVLYRQAFRLDPHVDRAYHREEMLASKLQLFPPKKPTNTVISSSAEMHQLSSNLENTLSLDAGANDKHAPFVSDTLTNLIRAFPDSLTFEPENELEPVLLNTLPPEMLLMVLRKLDVTSLERFAKVSRKARVLTLDSVYWREAVSTTYKPPQISDVKDMVPVIHYHNADFRRVFIEHPRIRLDGVYIAICHYVRPGLSENSWVNISHLVTYHRYLRFFPNGQVLSLLANEEHGPQQVIPILKPTLRMKGLFIGAWYLSGTTLNIINLVDASGKITIPLPSANLFPKSLSSGPDSLSQRTYTDHQLSSSSSTETPSVRYAFDMSLNLRSRPLGRWNRLDMISYDSVNLETGDVFPVALKHERPFWFSKVKSYV